MSVEAWLAVAATLGALVAMAAGRIAAERALGAALAVLVLAGALAPERALAGVANPGVATVALLFVVAAAVRRSGALTKILAGVLGAATRPFAAQLRLMLPVAGLSAFVNNTPVVAMLLPEVRRWAAKHRIAPSYLLLPLSYAAIVGGMCTLIGSSTNLLVHGLLVEAGHEELGILWISAVGVPAALAAIVVIALFGRRLLPGRGAGDLPLANPRRFTAELLVEAGGPLAGKRLGDVSAPGLRGFAPVEIQRAEVVIAAPSSDHILEARDRLLFAAPSAEILEVHGLRGLAPLHREHGPAGVLVEAVVGQRCPLVGGRVGDGSFRAHYGAAVIAVARDGERTTPVGLGAWLLEPGDVLLLEADRAFVERHRHGSELVLVTDHGAPRSRPGWHGGFSLAVVVAMVVAAAAGVVSMLVAALAAACAVIAARVISWEQVAGDVDWRVLMAIAAAIGLGAGLQDSGAAAAAASGLVELGGGSPWVALALIYVATTLATELVTNNAAAVLMLPIALDTASDLQVSPLPFVAVVMVAASASFMTPIGYQTNLMVYGPGGYRFGDFARAGAPVALAVAAVTIALAPRLWPF